MTTSKENWKYLIGSVGAIAMLLIGVWLNSYVQDQREQTRVIREIHTLVITKEIKDSLQNANIARVSNELLLHKFQTEESIEELQNSIAEAQEQLKQNQYYNP